MLPIATRDSTTRSGSRLPRVSSRIGGASDVSTGTQISTTEARKIAEGTSGTGDVSTGTVTIGEKEEGVLVISGQTAQQLLEERRRGTSVGTVTTTKTGQVLVLSGTPLQRFLEGSAIGDRRVTVERLEDIPIGELRTRIRERTLRQVRKKKKFPLIGETISGVPVEREEFIELRREARFDPGTRILQPSLRVRQRRERIERGEPTLAVGEVISGPELIAVKEERKRRAEFEALPPLRRTIGGVVLEAKDLFESGVRGTGKVLTGGRESLFVETFKRPRVKRFLEERGIDITGDVRLLEQLEVEGPLLGDPDVQLVAGGLTLAGAIKFAPVLGTVGLGVIAGGGVAEFARKPSFEQFGRSLVFVSPFLAEVARVSPVRVTKTRVGDITIKGLGLEVGTRSILLGRLPRRKVPVTDIVPQPAGALESKVLRRTLDIRPVDIARIETAVGAGRILRGERGVKVTEPLFELAEFRQPKKASKIIETFIAEEKGQLFGSAPTIQQLRLQEQIRPGDIDIFFPSVTGKQLAPKVSALAITLRRAGEGVRVSPRNVLIIESFGGVKLFEAKAGADPLTSLASGELAQTGFAGLQFGDVRRGQALDVIPFGDILATRPGEQFIRKGAAVTFFTPEGVLPRPARAKDVPSFLQTGLGILDVRRTRLDILGFRERRTVKAERFLEEFIGTFPIEQRRQFGLDQLDVKIPITSPAVERARATPSPSLRVITSLDFGLDQISPALIEPSPRVSPRPSPRPSPRISLRPSISPGFVSPSLFPSIGPSPFPSVSPRPSPRPSARPSLRPSPDIFGDVSPFPSISPRPSPRPPPGRPPVSPGFPPQDIFFVPSPFIRRPRKPGLRRPRRILRQFAPPGLIITPGIVGLETFFQTGFTAEPLGVPGAEFGIKFVPIKFGRRVTKKKKKGVKGMAKRRKRRTTGRKRKR